jgi:hypothetical protein
LINIALAIGVGCFSDGDFLTSTLFVNFAMVIMVALLVRAVYAVQMIQLNRNPPRNNSPKGRERMQKLLFARFDTDGNGTDFAEVQKILEKIDPPVSEAEAAALFRWADVDGSSIIGYQEFSDAINGTPLDLSKLVKRNDVSNADHVRKAGQAKPVRFNVEVCVLSEFNKQYANSVLRRRFFNRFSSPAAIRLFERIPGFAHD